MLDEAAAGVESAWISTIHGFCARVLRAHALEAGIDPVFRSPRDTEMQILQREAFALALEEFVRRRRPGRLDLLARYNRDRLRRMVVELHSRLRAGRPGAPAAGSCGAAQCRRPARPAAERRGRPSCRRAVASWPCRTAWARRSTSEQAPGRAGRRRPGAAGGAAERSTPLPAVKDARGLLDFDDLELVARDLLRDRPESPQAYRDRFAEVMVDEFQDTNQLQVELVELVCGGDLFLVGDEFQSIYRFRRADVEVYREQQARGRR